MSRFSWKIDRFVQRKDGAVYVIDFKFYSVIPFTLKFYTIERKGTPAEVVFLLRITK